MAINDEREVEEDHRLKSMCKDVVGLIMYMSRPSVAHILATYSYYSTHSGALEGG